MLCAILPHAFRPARYIGSTGPKGLHHLVFEAVDNSVDECMAGHATEVSVSLLADGSCRVEDDGRGIPCDVHPKTGKSALETVLTVLHAGGKFGGGGYKVSGGLHGVGISVVNALSEALTVEVKRDGNTHKMSFCRGDIAAELAVSKNTADPKGTTGTSVTFLPDDQIFKGGVDFEPSYLVGRLDELAYVFW